MKKPHPPMPLVPRNKADPTQSSRAVNRMRRDIEWRYYGIKTDLRKLLDEFLNGYKSEINCAFKSAIICNNEEALPSLYWVNAGEYDYTLDGSALERLSQRIQAILEAWLLEGGANQIWAGAYVAEELRRGVQTAFGNLAKQSEVYAQQTALQDLIFSTDYQRRIGVAYAQTYSEWKGISDVARADIADVISNAVARGVNPRETAKIISDRLDVSMSKAFNIAQTEQVGAYRKGIWDETEDAQKRLGLQTRLLWLSALKPTTREWHASRHGRTYTIEEVKEFYSQKGNRYHCYCSQQPIMVNEKGEPLNKSLVERLAGERQEWLDAA